jgi:hypothetical protein
MRPTLRIHAAALAAIVFSAAPAFAIPSIRLSWDQCVMTLGGVRTVDSEVRHRAVAFRLDHASSAMGPAAPDNPCGGLNDEVCLRITSAGYVTEDMNPQDWTRGQAIASASGAGAATAACDMVGTKDSTWGTIKAQYR